MRFESDTTVGTELELDVDESINDFEKWFVEHIDQAPLTRSERAIIKTYMNYHLVAKKKNQNGPSSAK